MKKVLNILLLSLFVFSCQQENLERNEPAFQAEQDGVFWRATQTQGTINAFGILEIKGFAGFEEVTLTFPSAAVGVYELGNSEFAKATYRLTSQNFNLFFETGNNIGGSGILEIKQNNIAIDGTIVAEFRFKAIKTSGESSIPNGTPKTFNKGWIYKVKVNAI